ncbi:MAG: phosphoglucosamine mutase [Rhodospirillaceae bacterium]|nr:phosphoglucosamine mutase [Rhodospirillaceae bacterium]
MRRKLFGTDGVRGTANEEPVTAETALKLAMAAGRYFAPVSGKQRPLAVIGKDTRLSGYMLESAMVAGFTAIGMDVVLVGPMVTPGVAMLTRSLRADLGVMLSASHNPYSDNGIKLFGPDGFNLSDEIETSIENLVNTVEDGVRAKSDELGRARRLDDAAGRYIETAKGTFPKGLRLDGLKLVIDCANGAAYNLAPRVFFELGAEVIPLGVNPDGFNINQDCGAVAPEGLSEAVLLHGAHAGIALDGDADRLVLVDEFGLVVDGDQTMAAIATAWQTNNQLKGDGIVSTVMSNLGLERYLFSKGLVLHRTDVGDRYVLEYMRQHGMNLGGEQSGHIIMSDYATTGDGIIAALQVLAISLSKQKSMSEVTRIFTPVPQILKNITIEKPGSIGSEIIKRLQEMAEERIKDNGRILIRKSGTEPVLRVMIEGENRELIGRVVDDISTEIEQRQNV